MAVYELVGDEISIKIKSLGAELVSLMDMQTGQEYMWDGKPEFWSRTSPVLFPFVGKLKNQQYSYQGQVYNPKPHGFARDMEFAIEKQEQNRIVLGICDTEETRKVYPFAFHFSIEYCLSGKTVQVSFLVENKGEDKMFFSLGAHPGFKCPIKEGEKRSDYFISFGNVDVITSRGVNIATGLVNNQYTEYKLEKGCLSIADDLFENDALVLEKQVNTVALLGADKKPYLTLHMEAPVYGIWSSAQPGAPFICIEPWFGRCDAQDFEGALEEREYQNCLEPGEEFETAYTIDLS